VTPWFLIDGSGKLAGDIVLSVWIYVWALWWVVGVVLAARNQARHELIGRKRDEFGDYKDDVTITWVAAIVGAPFWPLLAAIGLLCGAYSSLMWFSRRSARKAFAASPAGRARALRESADALEAAARNMPEDLADDTMFHAKRMRAEAKTVEKSG